MIKKSLRSGAFREGRSGYSKHNFFFWPNLHGNGKPPCQQQASTGFLICSKSWVVNLLYAETMVRDQESRNHSTNYGKDRDKIRPIIDLIEIMYCTNLKTLDTAATILKYKQCGFAIQ